MIRKTICSSLIALVLTMLASAQTEKEETTVFTLTGSPVVTVFANYHAGFADHNDVSGFELTRAYLGYQFKLSPTLSGRAIVDAVVPVAESASNDILLKNAMLTWKDKGFTINGGLIGLLQFGLQEKFWQYRYMVPSFQDLYKMGPSADLGVTAEYRFVSWLSADLSLTNGEGFKRVNKDNNYRYGAGITVTPFSGFTFRAYADQYDQDNKKSQQTLALFAGYQCDLFSLGAEYNYQANNLFINGNDYYGYSVYTNVPVAKKWNLFVRYDNINSKNALDQSWYLNARDLVIAGFEYRPLKPLRIAPNYRYAYNNLVNGPVHEAYVNVEFNW